MSRRWRRGLQQPQRGVDNRPRHQQLLRARALPQSFAAALAQTNSNGEIIVLDSGGYGPSSITQPVTITAPVGIRASVFTATFVSGLKINTTGNVTIKGISFLGGGNGDEGIEIDNVGTLSLDNVEIQDFMNEGITFVAGKNLFVSNSVVRNCQDGLLVGTGSVYVRGSAFLNNVGDGVRIGGSNAVVVVDSVASFNGNHGIEAGSGTLDLQRFQGVLNGGTGIVAEFGATVRFDYSLSSGNLAAFVNNGSTLSGSSPGTSVLVGSQSGTLSGATTLQ